MSQELAKQESLNYAQILEKVITGGDLSLLTPEQRTAHYLKVCESMNLNPLTKPFAYIELKDKQSGNKRIVLYALKDACEQLRKRDKISIEILERLYQPDIEIYLVRTRGVDPFGRYDEAIGAVSLKGLNTEDKANAIMKCETKAKRRVTLSICGLGFLDESEIDSIPGAKRIETNLESEVM